MSGECQSCGAQVRDGWTLCGSCRKAYAKTLHGLRVALHNLRQVANREVRLDSHEGHADPAIPQTPVNLSALDMLDDAWGRISQVAATIGAWGSGDRLLTRMQTRMADLCRTPSAGHDQRELTTLLGRVRARCERRKAKPFIGRCPNCDRNVEAETSESITRCQCGAVIDCTALRDQTRERFDQVHITTTPAGAATWCTEQTGHRITRKDVDNWIRRKSIDATPDEDHCYQFPIGRLLELSRLKKTRLQVDAVS